MTTSILAAISAIVGSAGAIFAYLNSPSRQRRKAEKSVAHADREFDRQKAEIERAVYTRDDAYLNALVQKLLYPCLCVLCFGVFAAVLGCSSPAPVYIPTDRKIESCTNSVGIACKAVPDAVFAEMLIRLQVLKDLEQKAKVDAQLSLPKN